jgi:hypothetical protein
MSKKAKERALFAKLDALYARLPKLQCKGKCSVACGPVPAVEAEFIRMKRVHPDRKPLTHAADSACNYLDRETNRCTVYAARPLICRAWGTVPFLSCMHGCVPDRWMTDREFLGIAQEIERIGGRLLTATEGDPVYDPFKQFSSVVPKISAEQSQEIADRTRSLRALLGGRVVGVTGDSTHALNWVDIDAKR